MKNSIISILLFISGITIIYSQERPVEGLLKEKDQTISRVKLLENEKHELVLFIADSSNTFNLDSVFQAYHYSDFTIGDSVKKLNDTIEQVVFFENGLLEMQNVQMDLKIKQRENGFSLKIDTEEKSNATGEFENSRTLEISVRYWCMKNNSYYNSMRECESTCSEDCYKRSF